jgi:ribosomal 50S subunit-associated protein YjgA (DUF615 family)
VFWNREGLADSTKQGGQRTWLLERLEEASKSLLDANDEWEYRRLLDVYWKLDEGLVRNLVIWGEKSAKPRNPRNSERKFD